MKWITTEIKQDNGKESVFVVQQENQRNGIIAHCPSKYQADVICRNHNRLEELESIAERLAEAIAVEHEHCNSHCHEKAAYLLWSTYKNSAADD